MLFTTKLVVPITLDQAIDKVISLNPSECK